jgi:hypothetical protein
MIPVLLLAAAQATSASMEPPEPTPTPAVTILLTRPEAGPPPQGSSLAEVAKRIKLRLPANGPRVLTNDSVKQLAAGVELTMSAAAPGGAGRGISVNTSGAEDAKKAKWQQRYRTALQRARRLGSEVKTLEAQASGLERDFYAHDDPVYRVSTIKPNWDKTLVALEKARADLEQAQKQPDEVLNAARRDGALPGWFRGLEDEATPVPSDSTSASSAQGPPKSPTPKPTRTPSTASRPVGPT